MTVTTALSVVMQILALYPTIAPGVTQAIADFRDMFAGGKQPTVADINILLDKIKAQSAAIQQL